MRIKTTAINLAVVLGRLKFVGETSGRFWTSGGWTFGGLELPGAGGLELTELALKAGDGEKLASGRICSAAGLNPDSVCGYCKLVLQGTSKIG